MGRLLKSIEPQQGGDRRSDQRGSTSPLITRKQAITDAGLSEDQGKDALRVASLRSCGGLFISAQSIVMVKLFAGGKGGGKNAAGMVISSAFPMTDKPVDSDPRLVIQ